MNFTNSPYEKMMKEIPRPGRGGADRCAGCRYFREAVLPLDPVLSASICEDGPAPDTRLCSICGRPFLPEGRQAYCSEACKAEGNRRRSRERMRKKRDKTK